MVGYVQSFLPCLLHSSFLGCKSILYTAERKVSGPESVARTRWSLQDDGLIPPNLLRYIYQHKARVLFPRANCFCDQLIRFSFSLIQYSAALLQYFTFLQYVQICSCDSRVFARYFKIILKQQRLVKVKGEKWSVTPWIEKLVGTIVERVHLFIYHFKITAKEGRMKRNSYLEFKN